MFILKECWLAMPKDNTFGLVCVNTGDNIIGDIGCYYLSRVSWPLLK
jgi:hypothetical protein